MEKMRLWNGWGATPETAKKTISAGRLKGFTDIDPMYRICKLTEMFGPCGIGWKFEITNTQIVNGANDEKKAFITIHLFYATNEGWSEPVVGIGGSSFVSSEKNGLYTNDECLKMALTDALGTATKYLGLCADVYSGGTKYITEQNDELEQLKAEIDSMLSGNTDAQKKELKIKAANACKVKGTTVNDLKVIKAWLKSNI